jgi:hypothetical protein
VTQAKNLLLPIQIRAKSVLLRDLEELRAKRIALENPIPVVEEMEMKVENVVETDQPTTAENTLPSPQKTTKEEDTQPIDHGEPPSHESKLPIQDPPKDTTKIPEASTAQQGPSPPPSSNETASNTQLVGLGINTQGIATIPGPDTAELHDSAIDSLFEDNENNTGDSAMSFDQIDFSMPEPNANTQTQDLSQGQHADFDLSTFQTTSQDFNMPDLHTSNDANNNTNNNGNKQRDDRFEIGHATGGDDPMDLDPNDFGMARGEESTFEDLFFGSDDVDGLSGGAQMEHGEFDNAFFGLDN